MPIARLIGALSLSALLSGGAALAQNAPSFMGMWGSQGSGSGQLNYPYGICASPDGSLYVSDQYNFRIVVYTVDGQVLTSWGSRGSGPGQFLGTIGIGIDASGRVYVADYGNNRVQVFDRNGAYLREWFEFRARDVAIAPDGLVHVVTNGNPWVDVFTPEGAPVRNWAVGVFNSPTSIAFDAAGDAYVADEGVSIGSQSISRWSPEGILLARWGSPGAGQGQLSGAAGIAIDGSGLIYVAEHVNNRVQVFSRDGAFIALWGTSGSGAGQFSEPADVAVDAAGLIYVVDMSNHRIQKFGYQPVSAARTSWGGLKSAYR